MLVSPVVFGFVMGWDRGGGLLLVVFFFASGGGGGGGGFWMFCLAMPGVSGFALKSTDKQGPLKVCLGREEAGGSALPAGSPNKHALPSSQPF